MICPIYSICYSSTAHVRTKIILEFLAQQVGLVSLSVFPYFIDKTGVYVESYWMGLDLAQRNFGRCSTENDWIICDK